MNKPNYSIKPKEKGIYLDYAATTPVSDEVMASMEPYFQREYGNPGSFNTLGMKARDAVDAARAKISKILNCKTSELIFTSCGTESINLAIKGFMRANKEKGNHLITTSIEHQAVLETCRYLEKYEGVKVTYLDVNHEGFINLRQLEESIKKETILVSIMYANNEIGTIQSLSDIGKITKKQGIIFHTDACQAGLLNLDVNKLQVDLLSLNGSKIYGPKGVGLLYKKTGIPLHPLIHGGGQENNLRSGTENVPGIVGFAAALSMIQENKEKEIERLKNLQEKLIDNILKNIPNSHLNGPIKNRLPGNASITFKGLDTEALLIALNDSGIYASSGSACTSKNINASHVILAIGSAQEKASGTIRFTLGKYTTKQDIDYVLDVLPGIIKKLRSI